MHKQNSESAEDVIWENFRKRAEELQARSRSMRRVSADEKTRIFQDRAHALRQEKDKPVGDQDVLYLISFYVGGEFFGIEVKYLQEVYETAQVTEIPCTPDVLTGVMNYRGAVLTMIDLSILLDLRRDTYRKEAAGPSKDVKGQNMSPEKVLIVAHAGIKAGLRIEKLDDLLTLPRNVVQAVSSFFRDKNQIVKREAKRGNRPLLIIDPEALLNDERLIVNEDVS